MLGADAPARPVGGAVARHDRDPPAPARANEAIGDRALAPATRADAARSGILDGDVLCFPLVVANIPVGALGIQDGASIDAGQRRTIGGATVLIAIAVRNVQLFGEARQHSVRDGLTDCVNRGHGLEALDLELRRARRSPGHPGRRARGSKWAAPVP